MHRIHGRIRLMMAPPGQSNSRPTRVFREPSENRGPSDFDIRNAFSAGITYALPGPKINGFANAILRGWSIENIIQVRSAPPVDIKDAIFSAFNNGIIADTRPDLVPGQPRYLHGSQYPGGKAFNPSAFKDPPTDPTTGLPIRQGDVPRNFLRGFGAVQWDFAVHRDFTLRESLKLQFRSEMFNVLNHPNFGPPSGSFPFPSFGLSTQMLGQSLAGSSLGAGRIRSSISDRWASLYSIRTQIDVLRKNASDLNRLCQLRQRRAHSASH